MAADSCLCRKHRKQPGSRAGPSLLTDVSSYLVFTSVATHVCSEQAWVGVPPALPYASC